jgi:hypothetical protein
MRASAAGCGACLFPPKELSGEGHAGVVRGSGGGCDASPEGVGGAVDPVEGHAGGELGEFGGDVLVADELGRAGDEHEQVFDEGVGGAEQVEGFLLAVGAAAVGFGGAEECGEIGIAQGIAQDDEGVLAAGEVGFDVEAKGAAYGSLAMRATRARRGPLSSGRRVARSCSRVSTGTAPRRKSMARERMVGSISAGFSLSRIRVQLGGGSSRTLSRLLAASFMKADEVKRKMERRASTGWR